MIRPPLYLVFRSNRTNGVSTASYILPASGLITHVNLGLCWDSNNTNGASFAASISLNPTADLSNPSTAITQGVLVELAGFANFATSGASANALTRDLPVRARVAQGQQIHLHMSASAAVTMYAQGWLELTPG